MKRWLIGIGALLIAIVVIATLATHRRQPTLVKQPVGDYVALGDSVAAGDGLETYTDASACDRTKQAYPQLVAAAKNLRLTSLACSSATLTAGFLGPQTVNGASLKPQLQQLVALKTKPKLITITIGANDVGWTDLLSQCYVSTCGTVADTAQVDAKLVMIRTNLSTLLAQIKTHYGAIPPVVKVTGYYQLLPATPQNCLEMTGLTPAELTWQRQQQAKLNSAIQTTTSNFSFAQFITVDFSGHELCTPTSWVQSASAKAPFHPTDAGQQAIAKAVQ